MIYCQITTYNNSTIILQPTNPNREWFISPFGRNPWWTSIAGLIPALLATILIFMDQQITAVIINRKENKLKVAYLVVFCLFVFRTCQILKNRFKNSSWPKNSMKKWYSSINPTFLFIKSIKITHCLNNKGFFFTTERWRLPSWFVCHCHPDHSLFIPGSALVCGGHCSVHQPCQQLEERISMFSTWRER